MRIIPIMPKVKMMAGIAAISGKFGNMYFRTDKKSGRVSLCNLPKAQCALTEKQKLHHARFAAIARIVARMKAELLEARLRRGVGSAARVRLLRLAITFLGGAVTDFLPKTEGRSALWGAFFYTTPQKIAEKFAYVQFLL